MSHDEVAMKCLAAVKDRLSDTQYRFARTAIARALQDAFDLGFKAAGGSIIGDDNARQKG